MATNTLTYSKTNPDELRPEQGVLGQRFPGGTQTQVRASVTLNTDQVNQPSPMLVILFFGKKHYVTPEEFVQEAATYQKMQRRDCLWQLEEVQSNRHYYQQWAYPDKTAEAITAAVVRAGESVSRVLGNFFRDVKQEAKPSLEEFDDLSRRLMLLGADIAISANELTYERLYDHGEKLAQARSDFKRLMHLVTGFQQRAIGSAETMQGAAETLESTSFQLLALVPTLTLMDPIREAIYRIGLVLTRATARGIGAATADMDIVSELFGVLQADVPPLIADLVSSKLSRAMTAAGKTNFSRELVVNIARQTIEFLCDFSRVVKAKGFNLSEDDMQQLLEARLTSIICALLSTMLGGRPEDPVYAKYAKSAVESILSNLFRDYMTARDTAKAQNREVLEVFITDLPSTIVHVIQGIFTGAAMRNAASVQHKLVVQGAEESGSWTRPISYLKAQNASSIYDAETTSRLPQTLLPRNRTPLAPALMEEQRKAYENYSLPPEIYTRLRRCAHDFEWVIVMRKPSQLMARHFKDLWKWPKPFWVKGKSSHFLDKAGLVRKPMQNPATHKKYEDAIATWHESYGKMLKSGGLVREDGVVFHPDMLTQWAAAHPEDKAIAARTHALLNAINQHTAETADFTTPAGQESLRRAAGADYEQVRAFLARADVGFYPDLDMRELINQRTGERIVLGSGSEKGDELNYIERNRSMLDQAININYDNEHVPEEWRTADGQLRISAEKETPWAHALIQHGGDNEYIEVFGHDVIVMSSNGKAMQTNSERELELYLYTLLGPKYKPEKERESKAIKNSLGDPTNWAEAKGKGQRIRTAKVARIRHIGKDAVGDLPSVGEPIPKEDVLASLLHRGLSKSEVDLARVPNFSSYRAVLEVLERNNTLLAVDLDAKNIVVSVPANDGVADGLQRLATTYLDLSLAKSGATVWFELYTSDRPVTADYITGRLGPSQPPVAVLDPLKQYVSSAAPPANADHYAFAIQGPRQTFSPQPEKQSDRGAVNRHPHARRKDIRDAFLTDVARYDHTYAKVRGWQLFDVWDDRTTRQLSFTPAKICGLEVAVFNSGLVTAMGFDKLPGVASPRFLQSMAG